MVNLHDMMKSTSVLCAEFEKRIIKLNDSGNSEIEKNANEPVENELDNDANANEVIVK